MLSLLNLEASEAGWQR